MASALDATAAKARARGEVDAIRADVLALSHRVHDNPEVAWQERQASAWTAELLEKHGFAVMRPFGGLETSLEARWPGRPGGPVVALLGEYDALPEIGHGCGHNTMCSSSAGAAIAVARALGHDFDGEVRFIGTPAEEAGNGKVALLEAGALEDVSIALQIHPSDKTNVPIKTMAMKAIVVNFHGKAAHAAADPWNGFNALDAVIAAFNGIAQWRQHIMAGDRVHGIITHGGAAPNIIPDETRARFYVRSLDDSRLPGLLDRFRVICESAAASAGCTVTFEEPDFGRLRTFVNNPTLVDLFRANLDSIGWKEDEPDENTGSTDMSNVSWEMPTIHPMMACGPKGTPGHSREFSAYAGGPEGERTTIESARALAMTMVDLLADPAKVEAAWAQYREQVGVG
jgi:amidohydrolase